MAKSLKSSCRQSYFGAKGQRLYIQEWGATHLPVILMVHGFPGCAEQAKLVSGTPYWDSFRLIAMDRPGYGLSDVQKDMSPQSFALQVKSFLDASGIEALSLLSISGGAPYSVALATELKDRVKQFSIVSGVAPLTIKNFRYMNFQQKKTWAFHHLVPQSVQRYALQRVWKKGLDAMDEFLFTRMDEFSENDRKVLMDPIMGPELMQTMRLALQPGPDAILQDISVYAKDWNVDWSQVRCPVTVWHGTQDDVVHHQFARDIQTYLPQSHLRLVNGEGHYSLVLNYRDEILKELLLL